MLHGFDLSAATNTADRKTGINSRTLAGGEEIAHEEDLSVGDGDDVRWDVGADVASLGLDDWESGDGATAVIFREFASSLKKSAMEIEDVAWISFTAWGSS